MSQQQSYGFVSSRRGYPGQRDGIGYYETGSYINDSGLAKQIADITPSGTAFVAQIDNVAPSAHADGTYVITINGVDSTFTAATSSLAAIIAALIASINTAALGVTATDHAGAHTSIDLTANVAGVPFTTAVSGSGSSMTLTHPTVNVGIGTVWSYTVNGILVSYTGVSGDTALSIRDGLIKVHRALASLETVATANPSGSKVRLTAFVPGTGFTALAVTNTSVGAITANGTPQTIPFGSAVVKRTGAGTTDQSAMLPSGSGQLFLGVAERIHSNVDPVNATDVITPGSVMTVGRRGLYIVAVEGAVAVGDPVYFRHASGAGGTVLGAWRNSSDTSSATQVTQAIFRSSTVGADTAVVEFSLP